MRWQQLIGTTWTNISGATGQTWTLQAAQLGRQVRARVSYTDQLSGVESNRTSAPTPSISPANNNQGVLSISGTPTQNQLLTASVIDADGVPGAVSYQWQQSSNGSVWSNIGGATTSTLLLQQAQVGSFVRATATYVDPLGSGENVSSPATFSTVANVNDAPLLAVQTSSQNAVVDTSFSLVLPAGTFTDVDAGDTLTYKATAFDGSALPAWLTFDAASRTFTGMPAIANVGTQGVKVTATDSGGLAASEVFNISVTTAPTTVSLFSGSSTPTLTSLNDGSPLEVGMKFTSSVAGEVSALKFYRSASDTGPNILNLWTATGTNLASATFTNTVASGWQTVTLATPVPIAVGTTYIASYHTTGAYVATDNFFTTPVTNGPLTAPSNATAGGNGVYAYGGTSTAGIFPDQTFASANYYADVVFRPQLIS